MFLSGVSKDVLAIELIEMYLFKSSLIPLFYSWGIINMAYPINNF